ncbi:chemotaxis protein CheW [Alishewanella longhuensis]
MGTIFEIRLPLTLSIIDGFMCRVGNFKLILPQSMIQECLAFEQQKLQQQMLMLRNELVPLINLDELFNFKAQRNARQQLIVVQFGPTKVALLVDELFGELQAVIKPLHPLLRPVKAVSGTTLLNDGSVGFVLDIPALIQLATSYEKHELEEDTRWQERADD